MLFAALCSNAYWKILWIAGTSLKPVEPQHSWKRQVWWFENLLDWTISSQVPTDVIIVTFMVMVQRLSRKGVHFKWSGSAELLKFCFKWVISWESTCIAFFRTYIVTRRTEGCSFERIVASVCFGNTSTKTYSVSNCNLRRWYSLNCMETYSCYSVRITSRDVTISVECICF